MVDIEFIVKADSDLVIIDTDFHIFCIYSDQHLSVRRAVKCLILPVFFKNHVRTGSTALHDLYAVGSGDLDLIADCSRHAFKHFIIDDIMFSILTVIISRGHDLDIVVSRLIACCRIIHDVDMFS